jgi:simple sugar transport system permease protein
MDDFLLTLVLTLDAAMRVSTPLILAAMAGLFAERSGVVDISLEGKMLASAFAAASAAVVFGSPWLGLLAAIGVSCVLAMLHGFATITHKGDQIVSGVAINILAAGLTIILGLAWFHRGGGGSSHQSFRIYPIGKGILRQDGRTFTENLWVADEE